MPVMRLAPLACTSAALLDAHPANHAISAINGMIHKKIFRRMVNWLIIFIILQKASVTPDPALPASDAYFCDRRFCSS
jgi:hypothetical protein